MNNIKSYVGLLVFLFFGVVHNTLNAQVGLVSTVENYKVQYTGGLLGSQSTLQYFPFSFGKSLYGLGYKQEPFSSSRGLMLSGGYLWEKGNYVFRSNYNLGLMKGAGMVYNFADFDVRISKFLSPSLSIDFGLLGTYRFNEKSISAATQESPNALISGKLVRRLVKNFDVQPGVNITYWLRKHPKLNNVDEAYYVLSKKKDEQKKPSGRKQLVYFDLNHLDMVGSNTIDTNVVYCTYNNEYGAKTIAFELYNEENKRMKKFEIALSSGMNFFKIPLTKSEKAQGDSIGFIKETSVNKVLDIAMLKNQFSETLSRGMAESKLMNLSSLTQGMEQQLTQSIKGKVLSSTGLIEGYTKPLSDIGSLSSIRDILGNSDLNQLTNTSIDADFLKSQGLKALSKYVEKDKLDKLDFLNNVEMDVALLKSGFDGARLEQMFLMEKQLLEGKLEMSKTELSNFIKMYEVTLKEKMSTTQVKHILLSKAEQSVDSCKVEQAQAMLVQLQTSKASLLKYQKIYENVSKLNISIEQLKRFEKFVSIKEQMEMYKGKYEKYKSYVEFCKKYKIDRNTIAKQGFEFEKKIGAIKADVAGYSGISDLGKLDNLKTEAVFNSFSEQAQQGLSSLRRAQTGGLPPGLYFIKYKDGIFPQKTLRVNYK